MPRMIDLVRASALPSHRMQAAARGALTVPPAEMIEILVYLALHNKIFSQQARLTLAGYDEAASIQVAANPSTPKAVLEYWISPQNLRPALLAALLENPAVSADAIIHLAGSVSRDVLALMLKSARVNQSAPIKNAVAANPHFVAAQLGDSASIGEAPPQLATVSGRTVSAAVLTKPLPVETVTTAELPEPSSDDDVLDEGLNAYLAEHAGEIAAEQGKPFQPIGGIFDEFESASEEVLECAPPVVSTPTGAAAQPAVAPGLTKVIAGLGKAHPQGKEERDNTLQKIAKLDIKGRIQLAMKGGKEERSILIRDGTKVVALAVLESPKITDGEVERFASQKNVLEAVLRTIPLKRRFAKQYNVVRNLVYNPRSPLDLSLGLMKHLLVHDLKNLSGNKEVSDTVRKLALRMYKQKAEASKKKEQ